MKQREEGGTENVGGGPRTMKKVVAGTGKGGEVVVVMRMIMSMRRRTKAPAVVQGLEDDAIIMGIIGRPCC